MGSIPTIFRAVLALAVVAAFVVPASTNAGLGIKPAPEASVDSTGNNSELVSTVPIASAPGLSDTVVMSVGPDDLPRLEAGDRLEVSSEVQVSTTCVVPGSRCVGSNYTFNPTITARVVLAPSTDAAAPSIPLSESKQVLCKQRRPQRNHHCTLAFPNLQTSIGDPATLPCPDNACYVNLILSASNKRAGKGDVVVMGADRPDGSVKRDKGRLNVVHSRVDTPAPAELSSTTPVSTSLPLNEGKVLKRRVIYSVEIPAPKKGEVLAVDGSYVSTIDNLPFNTFIASRVIVAETPTSIEPAGLARSSVQFGGDVTETNGFNCTQGASGFATPCTSVKAGAARITRDAVVDTAGTPATLYVNLVASGKPLLYPMQRLKRFHRVAITPGSGLRVLRYTPPQ